MQSFFIAERERFELSNQVSPVTHLAGERLQPARPPLQNYSRRTMRLQSRFVGTTSLSTKDRYSGI